MEGEDAEKRSRRQEVAVEYLGLGPRRGIKTRCNAGSGLDRISPKVLTQILCRLGTEAPKANGTACQRVSGLLVAIFLLITIGPPAVDILGFFLPIKLSRFIRLRPRLGLLHTPGSLGVWSDSNPTCLHHVMVVLYRITAQFSRRRNRGKETSGHERKRSSGVPVHRSVQSAAA